MVRTAPNRDAAIAFLEYLSGPRAQHIFADGNSEYPAVADVPPARGVGGGFVRVGVPCHGGVQAVGVVRRAAGDAVGQGGAVDARLFESPEFRQSVLNELVEQRLLLVESERLGIAANDVILRELIAQIPALLRKGADWVEAQRKA